jgi:hypothetical protein
MLCWLQDALWEKKNSNPHEFQPVVAFIEDIHSLFAACKELEWCAISLMGQLLELSISGLMHIVYTVSDESVVRKMRSGRLLYNGIISNHNFSIWPYLPPGLSMVLWHSV